MRQIVACQALKKILVVRAVLKVIFGLVFLLLVAGGWFTYAAKQKGNSPMKPLHRVAHAGGGFNGLTYTNSLQALDHNADSFEFFEIDFSFTADGELVCIHDWKVSAEFTFGHGFDAPPTLDQFNHLIRGNRKYTNCTLTTLVEWLRAHPGKRIVSDVKQDNIRAMGAIVNKYPELREIMIPQIYHASEYAAVKGMGFRDVILTLYRWDANTPYILLRTMFMDVYAVTMPVERAYFARFFKKLGIPTYVHTINTDEGLAIMRTYGVTEIYTDWLPQ